MGGDTHVGDRSQRTYHGNDNKGKEKGLLINSRGIWTRETPPKMVKARTELEVGRILGWKYKPSEQRGKGSRRFVLLAPQGKRGARVYNLSLNFLLSKGRKGEGRGRRILRGGEL